LFRQIWAKCSKLAHLLKKMKWEFSALGIVFDDGFYGFVNPFADRGSDDFMFFRKELVKLKIVEGCVIATAHRF
jgi:hypothetical protein